MESFYKFIFLFFFTIPVFTRVLAQGPAPDSYSFESAASYHRYDKDVMKCIKYIERSKPGDQDVSIKKATRFVLEWQSGCPYVHFSQNVRIDAFFGDSPQLRIYYICGYVKYALKNEGRNDKVGCTYSGIQSVLRAYGRLSVKKDKNIEDWVKLEEQGKLKSWVEERLN